MFVVVIIPGHCSFFTSLKFLLTYQVVVRACHISLSNYQIKYKGSLSNYQITYLLKLFNLVEHTYVYWKDVKGANTTGNAI